MYLLTNMTWYLFIDEIYTYISQINGVTLFLNAYMISLYMEINSLGFM